MYERYDAYRRRPARKEGVRRSGEVQADIMVVALTAQIIICILLILTVVVVKKADNQVYGRVKAEYDSMTTDAAENEKLLSLLAEWTEGARYMLESLEGAIKNLLGFAEDEPAPPTPEIVLEGEAEVVEPAPESEGAPSQDAEIQYDYLNPSGVTGGAGGWFGAEIDETFGKMLAAPRGNTLAPFMIAGSAITPVEGVVTSPFAYRYHPITEAADFHNGIDIAAEEDRAILAALPGEVVEVGESAIYGNYIRLKHAENLETFYGHCSEVIAKEGMILRQGERIAKVGQTGMTTGPHVHFSVIVEGQYADPLWALGDKLRVVE